MPSSWLRGATSNTNYRCSGGFGQDLGEPELSARILAEEFPAGEPSWRFPELMSPGLKPPGLQPMCPKPPGLKPPGRYVLRAAIAGGIQSVTLQG